MAGSYNRIVLVGNLTRDPEIRYVDGGGKAVTKFALAINRKSKAGDETMYIDIVAWDRLGEICNQYLKKGMSALVEGRLVDPRLHEQGRRETQGHRGRRERHADARLQGPLQWRSRRSYGGSRRRHRRVRPRAARAMGSTRAGWKTRFRSDAVPA